MIWRNRLEQSVGSFQQQVCQGVPINEFKSPITRAQMILSRSGRAISCTQRTGNYCMFLTVAFVTEPRVSAEARQAPASQKILPCACQQSLPKPLINGPFRRKKTRPLLRSFSALPNKPSSATRSPEVAVSYISFWDQNWIQKLHGKFLLLAGSSMRCLIFNPYSGAWTCVTWAVSHEARQPLQVERSNHNVGIVLSRYRLEFYHDKLLSG